VLEAWSSVLVASPFHDLLPEEGVFAVFFQFVGHEDASEVIGHGAVLLMRKLL